MRSALQTIDVFYTWFIAPYKTRRLLVFVHFQLDFRTNGEIHTFFTEMIILLFSRFKLLNIGYRKFTVSLERNRESKFLCLEEETNFPVENQEYK